jgi:hypothetical protein
MNSHTPGPDKRKQDRSLSLRQDQELQLTVEFSTVEEMLRHDASQVDVPPVVESRLRSSLQRAQKDSPKAPPSWWRRILGLVPKQ